MPSTERIRDHILSLSGINHKLAVDCVFIYLQVGLTRCRIVRSRRAILNENYSVGLGQAEAALILAERLMWQLKPKHPEFDQMMGQMERLKFELMSLKQDHADANDETQTSYFGNMNFAIRK
jgi:hypothetical protein